MQIVSYPHPTLRHKSKPLRRVDAQVRKIVAEMFELMYEAQGVGLAANQVDLPWRLFVVNLQPREGEGEEMVFLNPVLSRPKGSDEKEEGCLSLVGLYGQVVRPEKVHLSAYNLEGEEISAELSGLMARVVQHETDHLNGVLFIDRLSETGKLSAAEQLAEFEHAYQSRQQRGEMPSDEEVARRLAELEAEYC